MTYAVSNLHGCYSLWCRLLKLIDFGKNDIMFILGDSVDIGDEPMELLSELSYAYNIWHVAGKHDRTAFRMLSEYSKLLETHASPDGQFLREMQQWLSDGGKVTFDSFIALDPDAREGILEYLGDLPLFEETKVGGDHFILMNKGITGFVPGTDPDDYPPEAFFGDRPVRTLKGFRSVVGARDDISSFSPETSVFRGEGFIAIDCGAGRGGRLGCVRLDDGREFYV